MRKIFGIVRAGAILTINFFVLCMILGVEWALGGIMIIGGFAYFGGPLRLARDRAIPLQNLDTYYQFKLENAYQLLREQGEKAGVGLSQFHLFILPDDRINAYSYDRKHIGVTKGLLALDEGSIAGVLAHEIGHCLSADSFFKRILFCDITIVVFFLGVAGALSAAFIWIIFALLCLCGVCSGLLSFSIANFLQKAVRSMFTGLQHIGLFIYQITVGLISRSMEYGADRFAVDMELGNELIFFLNRFSSLNSDSGPKPLTLRDVLYASHPSPAKRIKRLEKYCYTALPKEVNGHE